MQEVAGAPNSTNTQVESEGTKRTWESPVANTSNGTKASASASSARSGQRVLNARRGDEGEGVARRLFAEEPEIIPDKQYREQAILAHRPRRHNGVAHGHHQGAIVNHGTRIDALEGAIVRSTEDRRQKPEKADQKVEDTLARLEMKGTGDANEATSNEGAGERPAQISGAWRPMHVEVGGWTTNKSREELVATTQSRIETLPRDCTDCRLTWEWGDIVNVRFQGEELSLSVWIIP